MLLSVRSSGTRISAKMLKEYKFFRHRDCEYFPCHHTEEEDNFNCLFLLLPTLCHGKRVWREFLLSG